MKTTFVQPDIHYGDCDYQLEYKLGNIVLALNDNCLNYVPFLIVDVVKEGFCKYKGYYLAPLEVKNLGPEWNYNQPIGSVLKKRKIRKEIIEGLTIIIDNNTLPNDTLLFDYTTLTNDYIFREVNLKELTQLRNQYNYA